VLGAATELFHDEEGYTVEGIERARAMLDHQSAADREEAAMGGAWMLAMTLRALEKLNPGLGGEMLRLLGLTLAERDIL
jgi:hypothetical protein